jgi:hypothetical protein
MRDVDMIVLQKDWIPNQGGESEDSPRPEVVRAPIDRVLLN